MTFAQNPHLYVTWDESTVAVNDFLGYNVYRRKVGETSWIRIQRITDRGRTSYRDYTVESGITYEYAVTQEEDIAGDAIASDVQGTPPQASVSMTSMFLHNVGSPGQYVQIDPIKGANTTYAQPVRYRTPFNRSAPTAFTGRQRDKVVRVETHDLWDDAEAVWDALDTLQLAQRDNGATLLARGNRVHLFCTIAGEIERDDDIPEARLSFGLRETYYVEEV